MFAKAGIKRFNDVKSCAPPPGSYNPKLPEVASTAGISFQKSNRFPVGTFAIPMTPTGSSTPDCRRHNGSGNRLNTISSLPRRVNKMSQIRTSSTFSLPAEFDSNNYQPGDEEFAIHRGQLGHKDELEAEMQELQYELSHMREVLHTVEAERDTLRRRVEDVKQDLLAAETHVVESEQTLAAVESSEKEKGEKLMDLQSRIDTLEGSLVAAKQQTKVLQAKIEELQKDKENLITQDLQKVASQLEDERKKHSSLEAEFTRNFETTQQKIVHAEQELIHTRENLRIEEEAKQTLSKQLDELKIQQKMSDSRVTEMEKSVSIYSTQLQTFQQKELMYQSQLSNVQDFLKASEEEKELLQNQLQKFKQNFEQAEIRFTGLERVLEAAEAREKEHAEKLTLQHRIISEVDEKLAESQRELSILGSNNSTLQQTINDLLSQNHGQALDLVQLNEQLQENLRKTQELEARLSEESSKFNGIENELQHALSLAEHERRERAMSEEMLQSELETTRGKADYLYSELVNLQEFSKRADDERASLRQLLKEYTLNLATGASQILELQQALTCVESSEKEKDEKISKLESKLEEVESHLVLANGNLSDTEMKNEGMRDTISELNSKNSTLSTQVAQLNEELHSSQNQCNELDAILLEHQSQLKEKQQELQATLLLLETARSEKTQVESQFKSELEAKQELIAQYETDLMTAQRDLLKLEEEKDSLCRHVEKFKNVEEERNLLIQDLQDIQKHVAAMESEVPKLKEALVEAELSDQEKDDKIYCQQSRIEVIEENLIEANRNINHLQTHNGELQSLNADLQLKLTNQAIEVAQLKDDLDLNQCQVNELQAHLNNQTSKFNESQHELQQVLSLLENERNEHAAIIARLASELEVSNQNVTAAVQTGNEWKDRFESAAEERGRHIQRLKMAESKLEEYLNFQIRTASQVVDLRKSSTEVLILKNGLVKLEEQAKSSKHKLATVEIEMAKHISSSENWKALHDIADAEVKKTRAERIRSQETILQQDKQIKHLESQNATLEKLIGPFKEQLKVYKDSLDVEHDAAARQAKYAQEIADKYADIVGHQNPKQRIHHMQKLKNDNLTLKNENSVLLKKLTQAQKRLEDLEDRFSKSSYRRFDPRQAFRHQDAEDTQNIPPT
ncbi:unnamed protein product [Allacma fusca]|uniref:Hyaluronan-mediated motility receptor C-terminal domain-containing protein n=1 Tax=Allacma fusca TaxID=39272 RepID=A0A8J2K453_9HEXA|nr:unnamed protein product [Allacma fusca]